MLRIKSYVSAVRKLMFLRTGLVKTERFSVCNRNAKTKQTEINFSHASGVIKVPTMSRDGIVICFVHADLVMMLTALLLIPATNTL